MPDPARCHAPKTTRPRAAAPTGASDFESPGRLPESAFRAHRKAATNSAPHPMHTTRPQHRAGCRLCNCTIAGLLSGGGVWLRCVVCLVSWERAVYSRCGCCQAPRAASSCNTRENSYSQIITDWADRCPLVGAPDPDAGKATDARVASRWRCGKYGICDVARGWSRPSARCAEAASGRHGRDRPDGIATRMNKGAALGRLNQAGDRPLEPQALGVWPPLDT